MARRRLGVAARPAVQAAWEVHAPRGDVPMVFGSRYGDPARSLELLEQLVSREAMSPTSFGLSVHNAIGGLYSILRGDRANSLSVAAGAGTAAACVVEAVSLLADGAAEVLVVYSDTPLPPDYAVFEDAQPCAYAWAWRVARPTAGARRYTLSAAAAPASREPGRTDHLPFGLDVLRFVAGGHPHLHRVAGPTAWTWHCHDA